MDQEIKEGRGCGPNKDYVVLDMTHLGADTIMKRLPSIYEIGHNFANVDITKEPIPVVPTLHYQMGGIPTNIHGQVVVPKHGEPNVPVNGLYAVGECACVSVHGANRLGCNSLLDLLVFGRAAGAHIVGFDRKNKAHKDLPADAADRSLERLAQLDNSSSGEYAQDVADDIRATMQRHAAVFRTQALMDEGVTKIAVLAARARAIGLADKSKVFNTARVEALEVENLVEVARATMVSAAARHECRGAHTVKDYERPADDPKHPLGRNDVDWMKHTLWYSEGNRLDYNRCSSNRSARSPCRRRSGPSDHHVQRQSDQLVLELPLRKSTHGEQTRVPGLPLRPRPGHAAAHADARGRARWHGAHAAGRADQAQVDRSHVEFPPLVRGHVRLRRDKHQRQERPGVLTNMRTLKGPIVLKPLPGLPVVRDLIVDMTQFFKQYHSIAYLVNDNRPPEKDGCSQPEERDGCNGLYECILCASCSTACPSFWWNPDKFVGPAGLLQAYRFIADSRDQATAERLDNLEDPYRLFRCHSIMNCVDVCPKGLNPTAAIGKIKEMMVRRAI